MTHPETEADIRWAVGNAKRLERENERLLAALEVELKKNHPLVSKCETCGALIQQQDSSSTPTAKEQP